MPNDDTCLVAGDNECDDGGQGYLYSLCACGTDLTDCGTRTSTAAGTGDCIETAPANTDYCGIADGECDDGGVGSQYAMCRCGSDLADCGTRTAASYSTGDCVPLAVPNIDVLGTCGFNLADGFCDDGGADSEFSFCPCGSDTTDCGVRTATANATGDCVLEEAKPCFARTTTACRLVDTAASASAAFGACFGAGDVTTPAVAERVSMASLVAGDLVLSSPHATTRVLVNQHRAVVRAAPMVTISHATGTLTLTPDHMLLVDGTYQPARNAKPGSRLEGLPASIVAAVAATNEAIVSPLTRSSTILAAGREGGAVVASCFPEWVAPLVVDSRAFPLPFALSTAAAHLFPAAVQAFYDDVLEPLLDASVVPGLERLNAALPTPLALGVMASADVLMVVGLAAWSALSVKIAVAAASVAAVAKASRRARKA